MRDENTSLNYKYSSYLLDNAFHFFEATVGTVEQKPNWSNYYSESELKSMLLAVTTSVELILKAKIASLNWKELFNKVDEANVKQLSDGTLRSVNFEKCIQRIEKLIGGKIENSITIKIENIRIIRNQLTHFNYTNNQERFLSLISKGLEVFIEFYRTYIKDDFCEEKDRTLQLEKCLFDTKEYIKEKLQTVSLKLKNFERLRTNYFAECYNCYQDTMVLLDNKKIKCLFCENIEEIENHAKLISKLTENCIQCGINSLIQIERINEKGKSWECIKCGSFTDYPSIWVDINGKPSKNSLRTDL